MTKCLALSLEEDMGVYGPWVKWKFMKRSNKTKPSQGANQINWLEGLTALRFCCCFTTPVEPPIQWLVSPAEWFYAKFTIWWLITERRTTLLLSQLLSHSLLDLRKQIMEHFYLNISIVPNSDDLTGWLQAGCGNKFKWKIMFTVKNNYLPM